MGYNKRQFQKTNDKKVLHKVRKHWVVVSLAMLMALGGGALATHTATANADSTNANANNSNSTNRVSQNLNQNSKSTLVSAQSNNSAKSNNVNAAAQKANNTNVSAQSNANNNQTAAQKSNNNSASLNSQSIAKQANLLHQHILESANRPSNLRAVAVKAPAVGNANNSSLGRVSTNTPNKRMLGTDNSDLADYMVKFDLHKNDGTSDIIGQQTEHYNAGSDFAASDLSGWESDRPQASSTALYSDMSNTNHGVTFDGSTNIPSTWQQGNHTMIINLKQNITKKGQIIVQYNNMSDNQAAVSSKVYSDLPGQTYNNLQNDKNMVPSGYTLDTSDGTNGILSTDGLNTSNLNAIPFVDGVKTIKIAVSPSSMSANTENVIYEDAKDNNVQVGSTQITGKKDQLLNINGVTNLAPAGYNIDRSTNTNGLTPSDGNAPTFQKGGTLNIQVVPNGVTPIKPGKEAGYGTGTIQFISSTNGAVVGTKRFQGKDTDAFTPNYMTPKPTIPGYSFDNNDNLGNPNLANENTKYGSDPTLQVEVNKDTGYHAKNVQYHIEYENVASDNHQVGPVLTESGKENTPINYSNYTTLLPANSSFVGLGTHDDKIVSGDTNVVLVKVANAPANINVNYIDQKTGSDISHGTINGSDVNYGSDINVDNYTDKNGRQQSLLPSGYTPLSNQKTNVKVNSDVQNLDVLVTGNKVSDTTPKGSSNKNSTPAVTIQPIEQWYDKNGNKHSQNMTAQHNVSLTGAKYDSDTSVNLNTYKPDTDAAGNQYIADSADNNGIIKVDKSGNAGDASHTVKLYYDRISPMTVNFVNNETGKTVSSYNIKPSTDDVNKLANGNNVSYDVTKGADQSKSAGYAIPKGYNALADQQSNAMIHAMYPNVVNYMVEGKPVTVNYQVKRTTDGGDGAPGSLSTVKKTAKARIGDTITMSPTDKSYQPAGYNVDSADHPVSDVVTPGATDGTGAIQSDGTTFKYDATDNIADVTPIEIKYINQSGVEVGHKAVKGTYGNQINVTDPADGGLSVPSGYSLANPDENTTYEFNGDQQYQTSDTNSADYPVNDTGKKGQLAEVDVVGNSLANGTVQYNIQANEMSDGKVTNKVPHNNITYNGANGQPARIGDKIMIGAGSYNPDTNAYSPTYSDANAYFTVNGNGSVTPSNPVSDGSKTLGLNYDIKQGYITVTYKDSNGNTVGSPITTNKDINTPFNISDYESNPPVVHGQHYAPTGVQSDATKYTSTNQSPVITVSRWDTAHIQYKDTKTGKIVGTQTYSGNPSDSRTSNVPSDYFTTGPGNVSFVPSGYKLDKDHPYEGSTNLSDTTYTVDVVNSHSSAPTSKKKIPSDQLGEITVHYVPTQYEGNDAQYDTYKQNSTDTITTYGNGANGDSFNSSQYMNALSSTTGVTGVHANPNSTANVTNYNNHHAQDFYIFYTPAKSKNTIENNIRYLDEDNGDTPVGSVKIYGTAGQNINYSDFDNVAPSGYVVDRPNSTNSTFTANNANDDILVRKSVPNQTYGKINVEYIDQTSHAKVGRTDHQFRETGSSYDAAQTINTVPKGYQYVQVDGGISNAPSFFPDPSHPQLVKVIVKKAPAPYTTYNIRYMVDGNPNPVSQETVTGATGTLFNYSSYEDDIPNNYSYAGVSHNMPTIFNNNDTTGDSVAPAQNIDINVTPAD